MRLRCPIPDFTSFNPGYARAQMPCVQSGLRLLLQGRNDLVWIESKNSRERHEFHDRDSPLSTFEAGDEGPGFSQAGRKIGLRHSRRLSPCDEEADQGFVTFRSA